MIDRDRIEAMRRNLDHVLTHGTPFVQEMRDSVHAFLADVERLVAERDRLRRERDWLVQSFANEKYSELDGAMSWPRAASYAMDRLTDDWRAPIDAVLADALAAHDREQEQATA